MARIVGVRQKRIKLFFLFLGLVAILSINPWFNFGDLAGIAAVKFADYKFSSIGGIKSQEIHSILSKKDEKIVVQIVKRHFTLKENAKFLSTMKKRGVNAATAEYLNSYTEEEKAFLKEKYGDFICKVVGNSNSSGLTKEEMEMIKNPMDFQIWIDYLSKDM